MNEQVTIEKSVSLEHVGRIYQMINEIPFFKDKGARINSIEVLPGGLTNSNYKVVIDNVAYALRIAGAGTEEYLNRPAEKHAAGLMSDIGINAEVIYYNEKTGNQVCMYIHGKTLHIPDFKEEKYIKMAARLFKKYHKSDKEFIARFDLLKETYAYKNLLREKNYGFYEGEDKFVENIEAVKAAFAKVPPKLAPCHNDPLCENWLDDEKNFYLIDWEYCGMNDPMFDLAALSLEADFTEEEEKMALTEYFGGELSEKQYGALVINKFMCDALWSYWAVLQIAAGKPHEEYWPYGQNRYDRAYKLINDGSLEKAIKAYIA